MAIQLYTARGAVCGQFVSGEMLCGQAGDQYTLPPTMTLEAEDFDVRVDTDDRALADGSAAWGGQVKARKVTVSGYVGDGSLDPDATRALLRDLRRAAIRQDQHLVLDPDDEACLRLRLLESCDTKWEDGWGRSLASVRLTWLLADPFWYAVDSSSHTETLTGDGTFTVDTGTLATWWMAPTITIEAPAGESVPSVSLVNETDDGIGLVYSDPGLQDGADATIDCGAGTATRAGSSTIRYLSGRPLRLLPGVNVLAYEGAACTLTITWTERWI